MKIYSVIMAGGAGTRFWPRSRKKYPKQLLNIFDEQTLIQSCFARMKKFSDPEHTLIVTNKVLKSYIQDQLTETTDDNYIIEPFGRNTAPCIALSALKIAQFEPESVMVVVPADHLIQDEDKFEKIINAGIEFAAKNDALITIGIKPTHPETGYGYIQSGEKASSVGGRDIFKVKTFAEKPDKETALRFLESGDFFWNSGIFIWRTSVILEAFENFLPDIYEELLPLFKKDASANFEQRLEIAFQKIRSISIDYGVMQEAPNVFVIPGDFTWNDVGSWDVVAFLMPKDDHGNSIEAKEKIILDSKNNYVYSPSKVVGMIGMEDVIIIDVEDAMLVCKKGRSQDVKTIVDELKLKGLEKYL